MREMLDSGRRFAIIDRLPMAEMDAAEAAAVYWLLSSMVSRPVAQKLDGTMIYDVLDTGQQALPGSGIRPDKTNSEIRFHNDNAYNDAPARLCRSALPASGAKSGGDSRVIKSSIPPTMRCGNAIRTGCKSGSTSLSGSIASANFGQAKAGSFQRRCSITLGRWQRAV